MATGACGVASAAASSRSRTSGLPFVRHRPLRRRCGKERHLCQTHDLSCLGSAAHANIAQKPMQQLPNSAGLAKSWRVLIQHQGEDILLKNSALSHFTTVHSHSAEDVRVKALVRPISSSQALAAPWSLLAPSWPLLTL